jgi:hypothetical protein
MSDKALVFISCGQFSAEEKHIGTAVCGLVDSMPGLQGYFAEQQSSPEGLSKHIFGALERAAGFIAIMHPRGKVTLGGTHVRASVWIEQETAIVGYIQATRAEGGPKVAAYAHKGIHREGVRETIILNPKEFETDDDVLEDLKKKLAEWKLQPRLPKDPKVSLAIGYERDPRSTAQTHTYHTKILMTNESQGVISNFKAELRFPRWFVQPNVLFGSELRDQKTATHRVFRDEKIGGELSLFPGQSKRVLNISYVVDDDLFWKYKDKPEFGEPVEVRVFVNDHMAGQASTPFSTVQNF